MKPLEADKLLNKQTYLSNAGVKPLPLTTNSSPKWITCIMHHRIMLGWKNLIPIKGPLLHKVDRKMPKAISSLGFKLSKYNTHRETKIPHIVREANVLCRDAFIQELPKRERVVIKVVAII